MYMCLIMNCVKFGMCLFFGFLVGVDDVGVFLSEGGLSGDVFNVYFLMKFLSVVRVILCVFIMLCDCVVWIRCDNSCFLSGVVCLVLGYFVNVGVMSVLALRVVVVVSYIRSSLSVLCIIFVFVVIFFFMDLIDVCVYVLEIVLKI